MYTNGTKKETDIRLRFGGRKKTVVQAGAASSAIENKSNGNESIVMIIVAFRNVSPLDFVSSSTYFLPGLLGLACVLVG